MAILVSNGVTDGVHVTSRAWINLNGDATAAIRADYNVNTITKNALGDFTINFTSAIPAGYAPVAAADQGVSTVDVQSGAIL